MSEHVWGFGPIAAESVEWTRSMLPKLESREDLHPTETQRKKEGLAVASTDPEGGDPDGEALLRELLGPMEGVRILFDPLNDCTLTDAQKVAKARELITAIAARAREGEAEAKRLRGIINELQLAAFEDEEAHTVILKHVRGVFRRLRADAERANGERA